MRGALSAVFAAAVLVAAASGENWPDGKQAAVVLTYDDAMSSQLDIAIPALDAAGLKGTFFLTGAVKPQDIVRWRAAAAEGHELGNHTLFHPCARGTYPMAERTTAESYTVDTMLGEIATMNTLLTAIDGKTSHAMATPCGNTKAGGADYIEPLRQSGLVKYVRGVGWQNGAIDPMNAPSHWFDPNTTGDDLIAAVKDAQRAHGLLIFGFHGVGGNNMIVTAEAHAALLAYLKAHRNTIWVAPFSTVMDYVTGRGKS